jgi:hypothetical protein
MSHSQWSISENSYALIWLLSNHNFLQFLVHSSPQGNLHPPNAVDPFQCLDHLNSSEVLEWGTMSIAGGGDDDYQQQHRTTTL